MTRNRLLPAAAAALAAVPLGMYLYVALSRLSYPYALEWVEGNAYLHVVRILNGEALYVPPGFDFIPMIYTPLYFYAAAPLAALTGSVMPALRLVSLLASLGAFAALYGICRARDLSHAASLLSIGLTAAAYALTGYWFDIGRVDMLFTALVLAAAWLAVSRSIPERPAGLLAALVLFLGFATKQQAVLAAPFLLLELVLNRRFAKAIYFGAGFGALLGAGVLAAHLLTGGWFWFYVYTIPSAAPLIENMRTLFWERQIFAHYYPLLALAVLGAWTAWRDRRAVNGLRRLLSLAILVAPLIGMSYLSMAKQWGYINGLLPAAAGFALLGAECLDGLFKTRTGPAWLRWGAAGTGALLVVFQLFHLRYDPTAQIPAAANREEGAAWVAELGGMEAPVFVPSAPYLLHLAGQPTHFHASSLGDLQLAAGLDPAVEAVYELQLDAIVRPLDDLNGAVLPNAEWYDALFIPENGFACEMRNETEPAFRTLTGATSYLRAVCTRVDPEPDGP